MDQKIVQKCLHWPILSFLIENLCLEKYLIRMILDHRKSLSQLKSPISCFSYYLCFGSNCHHGKRKIKKFHFRVNFIVKQFFVTDEEPTRARLYSPENGSKQANTDWENNYRRIKRFKVLYHSGFKRKLSKMMDTSYVPEFFLFGLFMINIASQKILTCLAIFDEFAYFWTKTISENPISL